MNVDQCNRGSEDLRRDCLTRQCFVLVSRLTSPKTGRKYLCLLCSKLYQNFSDFDLHTRRGHTGENPLKCSKCEKRFFSYSERRIHVKNKHNTNCIDYKCNLCDKNSSSKVSLDLHSLIHTQEKPYKRQICGQVFSYQNVLKRHLSKRHTIDQNRKQCQFCPKWFVSSSALVRHIRGHTKEKPFQCQKCEQCFRSSNILYKHLKQTHSSNRPFKCSMCEKDYKINDHLKRHMISHSGIKFNCSQCEKTFANPNDCESHFRRVHIKEKPHCCSICLKSFFNLSGLTLHVFSHTGEKPYKCRECSKAFSISSNLTRHMRTHSGEKPHKCYSCKKAFISSTELKEHRTAKHSSAENHFSCPFCKQVYPYNASLTYHIKSQHVGERPHKCSFCKKTFITAVNRRNHEESHSGEKLYNCSVCQKSFATNKRKNAHEKAHFSNRKSFQCSFCYQFYKTTARLNTHIQSHTKEKPHKCFFCEVWFSSSSAKNQHTLRIHLNER